MIQISRAPSPISQGNVSGVGLIIFGIVVIAVSIFIFKIAGLLVPNFLELYQDLEWWQQNPPKAHVERWVLAIVALVFGLAGISMLLSGTIEIRNRKKIKLIKLRNPQSPWLWDYQWNNGFNLTHPSTPWWSHLIGISIVLGFHAVAWAIAIKENFKGMVIVFPIGISVFTFLVALIFYILISRAKAHKKVLIKLESFPVRLGNKLEINLSGLNQNVTKKIRIKLQAIQEIYNYSKNGNGVRTNIIHEIEQDHTIVSNQLNLTFELPNNEFTTELSNRPARFWELHLYSECEGPDLDKRFLIPIY